MVERNLGAERFPSWGRCKEERSRRRTSQCRALACEQTRWGEERVGSQGGCRAGIRGDGVGGQGGQAVLCPHDPVVPPKVSPLASSSWTYVLLSDAR